MMVCDICGMAYPNHTPECPQRLSLQNKTKPKDNNIYFTWKKGKRKIICGITPLNENYLVEREMEMRLRIQMVGWRLIK